MKIARKTIYEKWLLSLLLLFITAIFMIPKPKGFFFSGSGYLHPKDSIAKDSTELDSIHTLGKFTFKLFKRNAHASYYADKFNGRKTASGQLFHNDKYTAAHRTLPFGTKVRVTNEANGESTMVTINDRGPFTKGRDIDLTKRAFRDIARHHGHGTMKVTIEIVEEASSEEE
jgi:rare lipoprotein A